MGDVLRSSHGFHMPGGGFPEEVDHTKLCEGRDQAPRLVTVAYPFFKIGSRVKIVRLLDMDRTGAYWSSPELIGMIGEIREVEELCNGEINYYMRSALGEHYVHEGELEPLSIVPAEEAGAAH